MEQTIFILSVIQSMGISLGVGASTMAILNFFTAIADGKIDETERNFMGITYIVLRVAMGVILFTWLLLAMFGYGTLGLEYFKGYLMAQTILVIVLFVNAFLMTVRIMPSTFGPAIQASTWYALGFIFTIYSLGLTHLNLMVFTFSYITLVLLAVSLINGVMAYLKAKRENITT
jgi:hypothetical protein